MPALRCLAVFLATFFGATGLATATAHASRVTVIAFTGWIPVFASRADSAVVTMTEALRARGAAAEVHDPAEWQAVGAELVGPRRPAGPVVLVGYSMGAEAVTQLAAQLGAAGIRVRSIVLLEAWGPRPIPANVESATHYYVSGWASPIAGGGGFAGRISNVDLRSRIPGVEEYGHVAVSKLQAVQDLVVADVMRAVSRAGSGSSRRGR